MVKDVRGNPGGIRDGASPYEQSAFKYIKKERQKVAVALVHKHIRSQHTW
jgi:hypothetical protein